MNDPATQTKDYIFAPQDLYNLLCHYTDGAIPLCGEVRGMMTHPQLTRKIGLLVRSDEWKSPEPLMLGYDGKRTMSWSKASGGDPIWEQREETPSRQ